METAFSHCKSMGNFLDAQGQLTPQSVVRSGRKLNLFEILCMSSLPASFNGIGSKTTEKRWRHRFPHYKSMGAFWCFGNQFWSNLPQNFMQPSPTPEMLYIKFDQDWPTGFRDIQVWKCGWQTTDGPLVYYKLTLWTFGSGELKMLNPDLFEDYGHLLLLICPAKGFVWKI